MAVEQLAITLNLSVASLKEKGITCPRRQQEGLDNLHPIQTLIHYINS